MWHFSSVTFQLWKFSTVTFCLKVDGLSIHPKKWTVCHTVTFWPYVILANPWLCHFVHFGFWFFLSIPCRSCSWFWQMTFLWHYPFNFFASTHRFRRPRSDRWCFTDYFSNPTARLEATVTLSSFPHGGFNHCDILSTPHETSRKASRWTPVTCDKTSTFHFRAKVDVLSQSR
jgi:hypothetical protein